jgi:hypothetical protein
VVITDTERYVDPGPITIRKGEFDILKRHEHTIKQQFAAYVRAYKREVSRRVANPALHPSALCQYAALKYFHRELGL